MICPKCNSEDITVTVIQDTAIGKEKKKGCLYSVGRIFLICITCGLWLVFGKNKSSIKTRYTHKQVAICQSCGNRWVIK